VYSRADLSRIATIVVALFLTATSANVVACEFRAADTQSLSTEDRVIFRDAAIRCGRFMRKVE
jgi:hypothetical protein